MTTPCRYEAPAQARNAESNRELADKKPRHRLKTRLSTFTSTKPRHMLKHRRTPYASVQSPDIGSNPLGSTCWYKTPAQVHLSTHTAEHYETPAVLTGTKPQHRRITGLSVRSPSIGSKLQGPICRYEAPAWAHTSIASTQLRHKPNPPLNRPASIKPRHRLYHNV